ncbi:right-handed parallel beta-helix repeat-containing protein [Pontiella sulfatireligans]|uniref:Glycoside hydrolase 120 insertion domain-containing protein n=1 Tax=Pontiella sulfatireligans TaxID=2750658 RepID=A0A6C2UEX8_9BACT|nr:right-handed parallel beta-helix repeat-containing protein [Pontiella sulfatireligans]VGO18087.1 hypothetical protein SCARR_00138 [Pontiella sulfatireligans]
MKHQIIIALGLILATLVSAKEYHVSKQGEDGNSGSSKAPFLTIQAAADRAKPGDVITVHEGIYREKIVPPRGGKSDSKRITYQAAKDEAVHIKGSEVITGWEPVEGDVWKAMVPNSLFKGHNPYQILIEGDWFNDRDRIHHTGEVYLSGKALFESATLENVMKSRMVEKAYRPEDSLFTWFCESDGKTTTLYANFQGADPTQELIEINARNSCFYPAETGINYITIRGFRMSQAAANWAAPTAEQVGLIGTFWSKGWIIENNVISDSKCSGITLGKDRASGHNVWTKEKERDGSVLYIEMIMKLAKEGWSKETVGSHIVRGNTIFNCGQTGICGSLGCAFSEISGNHIYDIHTQRQFAGAEIAGIKFHGPIDVIIRNNLIHNTFRGMWMDWIVQGTRVSSNVLFDNYSCDVLAEVNHGPCVFDNNIFLSGLINRSQGSTFVHNLIAGKNAVLTGERYTPYNYPHSTEIKGFAFVQCGDDRFYNNIFLQQDHRTRNFGTKNYGLGLGAFNNVENLLPMFTGGNLYYKGTEPFGSEEGSLSVEDVDPVAKIVEEGGQFFLEIDLDDSVSRVNTSLVATESLGQSFIARAPFENPDGSSMKINLDLLGKKRNSPSPTAGPLGQIGPGANKIRVW